MIKEIMDWEICKKEHIKKVRVDKDKINSIIKVVNARLKAMSQVKVDNETATVQVTDYYEVIKELLTALLLKHGMKSDNHECLISFFKKYYSYEYETNLMHGLKDLRNRASYEGLFIKKDYLDKNELEFRHIIGLLKKLINE